MGVRRNAAIYAGLVGSVALLVPSPAAALAVRDVVDAIDASFPSPTAALLVGVAGGALATGTVACVASAVSRRRRRRAERAAAVTPEDTASQPSVAPDAAPAPEAAGPAPAHARHFRVEEPREEAPAAPVAAEPPAAPAPCHAARDYEDIAQNYVRRATFRDRMARRAQGVAATLRERLDAERMDGVPVIERADGSVGDVGTSWWTASVGADSIISDSGFAAERDLAIPTDFTGSLSSTAPSVPAVPERRDDLSERVPFVDEGVYPERRTMEDLAAGDDWASALRSLDERLAADAAPVAPAPFEDAVGGADTLDEPDDLEPETAFIPFKPLAGHPEVVDAETYVDHLIEEEFSKSTSKAVRRTSKRFLRVLEGGTGTAARRLGSTTGSGYVGKHFAASVAAEA